MAECELCDLSQAPSTFEDNAGTSTQNGNYQIEIWAEELQICCCSYEYSYGRHIHTTGAEKILIIVFS